MNENESKARKTLVSWDMLGQIYTDSEVRQDLTKNLSGIKLRKKLNLISRRLWRR